MIKPFARGSSRTPLDTEEANEIVKACNRTENIRIVPSGMAEVKVTDDGIDIIFLGTAFTEVVENGVGSLYLVAKRTGTLQ